LYCLGDLLPNHLAKRVEILLKSLPNQYISNMQPHNVPAFLRIDVDVRIQQYILTELRKRYMDKDFSLEYEKF